MTRQLRDFNGQSQANSWYDLYDDWPLIEASLTTQYGIRIRQHADMPWDEFCALLSGLMPDTPLGSIISIRAEKDAKVRRGWSADQRRIYNDWRKRSAESKLIDPDTLLDGMKKMEAEMARLFGGGG
ncbi:Gp15 family bacteriophage protein [Paenibacillus sp. MCAF9]|uniref:Gp15 family bacteriophage protein n=1 Tax=Paenibacillus sp. MCAF9 TaxID=3233046 RepID=UPI003F9AFD5E